MGDVFGIGGVAQAGASAATAALNYKSQMDYNQKYLQGVQETNALNERLAHEQNEWNLKQWHRENEYNDPAAQGQRLRNAGLSAAAAAQQVSGGQASPLQSADLSVAQAPQPLQAPQLDVSGVNIIGVARALEDLKQSKIDTKIKQQDAEYNPKRLFCEQQLREINVADAKRAYDQAVAEGPYHLEGLKADIALKRSQNKTERERRKVMHQNWLTARKEFGYIDRFKDAELKQVFANIAKTWAEEKKAGKESKLLDQSWSRNEILRAFDKYGGVPDSFAGRLAILFATGVLKPEDIEENVKTLGNVIDWLLKGVKENLLPKASDVVETLLYGPTEDEKVIEEWKKQWKAEHDKQKREGSYSAGHGADEEYAPWQEP